MAAVLESPVSSASSSAAPIVRVTALRKSYGANEVLKGIDLHVQRGEVIAIIGKSGSGKRTLLRCINGLEEFPDGGGTVGGPPPEGTATSGRRGAGKGTLLRCSSGREEFQDGALTVDGQPLRHGDPRA